MTEKSANELTVGDKYKRYYGLAPGYEVLEVMGNVKEDAKGIPSVSFPVREVTTGEEFTDMMFSCALCEILD